MLDAFKQPFVRLIFDFDLLINRYGAGGFGSRDYRQFNDRGNIQRNPGNIRQSNGPSNYGNGGQPGYQNYGNSGQGMPNFMVVRNGSAYGGNYSTGASGGHDWWGN